MIYYLVFAFSSFFIFLASLFQRKNKFLMLFLILVSIVILASMAGLRDYSIGTDTLNYNNYYNYAQISENIYTYCQSMHNMFGIEYGFSVLTYIVATMHVSVHWFYFICELIIGINIAFVLFSNSKKVDVTYGWLTYCFIFYTLSFNILRQTIALSIILIAIVEICKRNNTIALLLIFLSYMFHSASLIALLIFAFGIILMKLKDRKQIIALIIVTILISILLPTIFKNFGSLGVFGDKYSQYFGQQYAGQQTVQSIGSTLAIRLPMIFLIVYDFIANKGFIDHSDLFVYMLVIIEAVILPFQLISPAMGRIVLYFGISKVIGYPLALKQPKMNTMASIVMKILFIIFLMLLFYYQVVISNNNMVYPYIVSNDF